MTCNLCRAIREEKPVFKNSRITALENITKAADAHTLWMPIKHLDQNTLITSPHILRYILRRMHQFGKDHYPQGHRILINYGDLYQTQDHAHFHLLAELGERHNFLPGIDREIYGKIQW